MARAHGLATTYRHGCRCDACTAKHTEQVRVEKQRRAQRPFSDVPHGVSGYQNWDCRCAVCVAAARAARKRVDGDVSRTGQRWTPDDLATLQSDLPLVEIAASLKRTYASVVLKRYALRRAAA